MIRFLAKRRKRILRLAIALFLLLNLLAFLGAYFATHTVVSGQVGFGRPRPQNLRSPQDGGLEHVTQRIPLNANEWLEAWSIPAATPKGTVLLFPGNGGSKGKQLIAPAQVFHQLGYNTLLVDFRGVGGSSGNRTTLGMREAEDVVAAIAHVKTTTPGQPIILYGVSMGTAAILRAIALNAIQPDAIILELPFVNLLDAVRVRLRAFHLPPFPMAELLVFWGSVQNGVNGFAHNPVEFARRVNCPTLVLQGKRDRWIRLKEVQQLVQNLQGPQQLVLFPTAGHQLLVTQEKALWVKSVQEFLADVGL